MSITDRMRGRVETRGEQRSVHYSGAWRSHDQFAASAKEIDARLTAAGVPTGKPVGVYMRNRPGPVAGLAVLIATGRPLIVLNPAIPDETVGDAVLKLRPAAVLADPEDWNRELLRAAVDDCGALGISVDIRPDEMPSVHTVLERGTGQQPDAVDSDVVILMPTSGTTGPPKYIPLRQSNLDRALETAQAHYMAGSKGDKPRGAGVQIVAVPSTNMSGLWSLITVLSGGGDILLLDKFEPHTWSEAVVEFKPKSVSLPPAALRMILDADIEPSRLASLKAVWAGAAPVGTELSEEFEATYGCPVLVTYGATEFAGAITGWSLPDWHKWKHSKRGSVGRLHPGVEIGVVDPDSGRVLKPGQMGLLQVRSAQVLGGSDQWLRTNDLGRIDEDGFVWIDGRSDDVINRGGFKIFPREVDECLESHPAVREAVTFGIDDRRLGQVPVSVVVTRGDPNLDDLIAFAKTRLPPYKVPVSIRVVDSIPRNAAMKVLRDQLRREW